MVCLGRRKRSDDRRGRSSAVAAVKHTHHPTPVVPSAEHAPASGQAGGLFARSSLDRRGCADYLHGGRGRGTLWLKDGWRERGEDDDRGHDRFTMTALMLEWKGS